MSGVHGLMAVCFMGRASRLAECLQLRVKDIDLSRHELVVRHGKGAKDRMTMFPKSLVEPMRDHLAHVRRIYQHDRAAHVAGVEIPYALAIKKPKPESPGRALGVPRRSVVARSRHRA
jgi:integrase